MRTSKQMARVITQIAERAGVDFSKAGAHISIENPPYMRLAVEGLGRNLVSVTHYYEQNGDLVPDPDMVFFTGYGVEAGWVPVSIQHNTGHYEQAAWVNEDGELYALQLAANRDQASFADMWAGNIKAQGFLEATRCQADPKAA